MTSNVSGNVEKQAWTIALAEKSAEAFEVALAPDVVLEATALNTSVISRDLVKATMSTAGKIFAS